MNESEKAQLIRELFHDILNKLGLITMVAEFYTMDENRVDFESVSEEELKLRLMKMQKILVDIRANGLLINDKIKDLKCLTSEKL